MYRIVNAVAVLSARLWDAGGEPRPLAYQLVTTPLAKAPSDRLALTLVRLDAGDGSLFNFNQKPTEKVDAGLDVAAQVIVVGDPWEPFLLGTALSAKVGR
ncbi:hypothetical protein [Sorangium sp. So ce233]|uniref:hypothetical protein n=1 Tax=Sorangium sp. So ce233 TaxID=3133290 RepID=UPI003F62897C